MTSAGVLWLVPTPLGGDAPQTIAASVLERVRALDHFVAEEPKTARAFLKSIGHPRPLASLTIDRLDHNTPGNAVPGLLEPLIKGHDVGLLSEAGCPALADPGSQLVMLAHEHGVKVSPLVGPSSIVLALMASGLEGQRFAFHGYLPVKEPARTRSVQAMEARSRRERETQIFIEAPYRNDALLKCLLSACAPDTRLCVASDLTLESETISTRPAKAWKEPLPVLDRRPTVFLLLAA